MFARLMGAVVGLTVAGMVTAGPSMSATIYTAVNSGLWTVDPVTAEMTLVAEGLLAGDENLNGFSMAIQPASIPLPAALPLFATALGGLGLLGWVRRRMGLAVLKAARGLR